MEQRALFIIPLDGRRQNYRYHPLFAEFLRGQLRKLQPDHWQLLHRRAAAWYEDQGDIEQAIHHSLAAHRFDVAARLIEMVVRASLLHGNVHTVLAWCKALPEAAICSSDQLCRCYAWALTHAGQLEHAFRYLDALGRLRASEAATSDWEGEVSAIRARMAIVQGEPPRAIAFAERALARLPGDQLALRGEVLLDLAATHQLTSNVEAACTTFTEPIDTNQAASNPRAAMLARYYLARLYMEQGRFDQAAQLHHQGIGWCERTHASSRSVCCGYAGLGALLYEWNNLAEATHTLQQAIELAWLAGEVKVLVYANVTLAQL